MSLLPGPALPPPATSLPRLQPAGPAPEAMRRVAQDFEAQALGALLQPIFATLPTDGAFGGGAAEAQWRPMLVDAFGKSMARSGGVGIAEAVLRDMLRVQAAASALPAAGPEAAVAAAPAPSGHTPMEMPR